MNKSGIYLIKCKDYYKDRIERLTELVEGKGSVSCLLTEDTRQNFIEDIEKMKKNNCLYVGQSICIAKRIKEHRSTDFKGNDFEYEVLMEVEAEEGENLKELLNYYEREFIKKYDTFNNGLNKTKGNPCKIKFDKNKSVC